jgi:acyl dehydratase
MILDPALVAAWADVVDDHNPLHLDPSFAATTRYGRPIVHGSLLVALRCDAAQASAGGWRPERIRFRAPVYVGDEPGTTLEATPL